MKETLNILFIKKTSSLEYVSDDTILDKIYFGIAKVPSINNIKTYDKNKTNNEINKIIKKLTESDYEEFIEHIKNYISSLEYKIPLYDAYTENLYIINRLSVYNRIIVQHYRFPDEKLYNYLKNKYDIKKIQHDNKKYDVLFSRKIKKLELMLEFLDNFNLITLEKTYFQIFYKYSPNSGKEIISCIRPSFSKYYPHLKPYYTRSEVINLALNLGINIDNNKFIETSELNNLCDIVKKNDITSNILLSHQKYIINKDGLGLMQYYTLQGSFFINQYLRNFTSYKTKNEFLEKIIKQLYNLCIDSPEFDKSYIVYRFIKNDGYLNNLNLNDIYTESGFMSTTRDPFYRSDLYKFGFILLKIKIPKNIKGIALCIETLSHFPQEEEIIFPPNSRFKLIAKNEQCKYHHIDYKYSCNIKTRYEFEWIQSDNKKLEIIREPYIGTINVINFLNINKKDGSLKDKILYFTNNYVNQLSQFTSKIGNIEFVNIAENYDSTSAYKDFYSIYTTDGFSIYSYHYGQLLYMIEIGQDNMGYNMYVNRNSRYNASNLNSNDFNYEEFIKYIACIAYYFDIDKVCIFANYKSCNIYDKNLLSRLTNKKQREFANKIEGESLDDINNEELLSFGNYCEDFYRYLKYNVKEQYMNCKNILTIELKSGYNYFDLDLLKKANPNTIFYDDDNQLYDDSDELYQIYKKTYLPLNRENTLSDLMVWIIENKCYLTVNIIEKLDRFYKDIKNPFIYDIYILNVNIYLYNRKLIKTLPLGIDFNIKKQRDSLIQKNKYRLEKYIKNIRED
jgi:hypothetical protein